MTARNMLTGAARIGRGDRRRPHIYADPQLNTPALAPEVSTVTTGDGAQLRVHAYGPADAQPIVLAHGWTCRIEYWNPQINALAGRFRVIAYDQRGHGRSTEGTRRFTSDVLADDFAAVLEATVAPRKRAVLVGHSMGGMTIMAWAGKYPEQVERYAAAVILANTGSDSLVAETTVVPFLPSAAIVRNVAGHVISVPAPLPPIAPVRAVIRARVMSPNATREQVEFCERMIIACKGRTRGRWGTALNKIDLRESLINLHVPTVVFAGALDRLTPPVHSERLAEAFDQLGTLDRYFVVPGVGHMGNVEAPDELNAEIVRLATMAKKGRRARRRLSAAAG